MLAGVHRTALLALSACGRVGFDVNGDAGPARDSSALDAPELPICSGSTPAAARSTTSRCAVGDREHLLGDLGRSRADPVNAMGLEQRLPRARQ